MKRRRARNSSNKSSINSSSGADRKRRKKPQNDSFFEGEEDEDEQAAGSSEDEGPRKQEDEDEQEAAETAHEKKVRLAKEYLDKLQSQAPAADEDDDEEDGDRAGRRDTVVADLLRQEQLEESGRLQKKLAARLVQPEGEVAYGDYVVRKHKLAVTALALSEDDAWGFSASKDGLILQWDVETGKSYKYATSDVVSRPGNKPSSKRVLALAVDSSGRYLASGGSDRAVHLWDVRSQKHIQAFPGHRGEITSLAFRLGTTQLFSAACDRSIKLWSAEDRSYMDTLFGHQSDILSLDSLRQERILSAGRDRTLRLWKVPEESQLVFRGYAASLESCCFVTNTDFLSGADDGSVALWSTLRKKPVYVAQNVHGQADDGSKPAGPCGAAEAWVGAVAVCRSSDLAASGAGDGKIQLWSIEDKSLRRLHTLPLKGFVNALTFARSGRFLLSGVGQEPRMGRWARNGDAKNGVVLHKLDVSSSS